MRVPTFFKGRGLSKWPHLAAHDDVPRASYSISRRFRVFWAFWTKTGRHQKMVSVPGSRYIYIYVYVYIYIYIVYIYIHR